MEIEIWKDVPEYEGLYQVSNFGNVKSLQKNIKMPNGGIRIQSEKILKPFSSTGYLEVELCKKGKGKYFKVHKLVAITYLNHIPCGHKITVDHIDHNKKNNTLNNLQLLTNRENVKRSIDKTKTTSKHIGVSFDKKNKKWVSQIYLNKKNIFLGRFKNEYDAHLAYQNKLKEIEK